MAEFHKGKNVLVSAGHPIKIATKTDTNNQFSAAPSLQVQVQGGAMNKSQALLSCLPLLLSSACTRAQTKTATEPLLQYSANLEEGGASASSPSTPPRELPDMPRPKQAANYRNRDRWRDSDWHAPFHLDETDRSWGRAMRHPPVLATSAFFVGLTAIQLIKTDRCIAENKPACNLVTGKNRAATYALNIPLTTGVVYFLGRFKQKGNVTGFTLLTFLALAYEAPTTYTANPHVLVCLAGRRPQCQ